MANNGTPKKFDGIKFVNIELKYAPALYLSKGEELPDEAQLFVWLSGMAKGFYRFGVGYSERSHSITASLTYKGGVPSEDCPCVTQHGKTLLSAVQKLWIVFELVGGKTEGLQFASDALAQLEDYIEDAVAKLL